MIKPALLLLALVLGGCASPSGVERPAIDLPVEWRTPVAGPTDKPAPWELLLAEPELRALVDEALASNRNLRATAARVDQAAATFGVQRSARFPQLAAQASGSRGMTSSVRGADNSIYSSGQLGGILSWELDLWGRMADASEASRQNWLSSEEALVLTRQPFTKRIVGDKLLVVQSLTACACIVFCCQVNSQVGRVNEMTRADKPSEPEWCLLCGDAVARRGFAEWRSGACRHARVTASPNPPYELGSSDPVSVS